MPVCTRQIRAIHMGATMHTHVAACSRQCQKNACGLWSKVVLESNSEPTLRWLDLGTLSAYRAHRLPGRTELRHSGDLETWRGRSAIHGICSLGATSLCAEFVLTVPILQTRKRGTERRSDLPSMNKARKQRRLDVGPGREFQAFCPS